MDACNEQQTEQTRIAITAIIGAYNSNNEEDQLTTEQKRIAAEAKRRRLKLISVRP